MSRSIACGVPPESILDLLNQPTRRSRGAARGCDGDGCDDMRRVCITGGAGFIGSALADRLSKQGADVVVLDDFRTGRREFVADLLTRSNAALVEGDVLDGETLKRAIAGCDWVFQLQTNANVRHGLKSPTRDLEQNTIATATVLEAMRIIGVNHIAFASTGSVYGSRKCFRRPRMPRSPSRRPCMRRRSWQARGLIAAYANGLWLHRLDLPLRVDLGWRYTHGHVFDFYRSLKYDPSHLSGICARKVLTILITRR
jgi:UDP-glucose 4-epimerase